MGVAVMGSGNGCGLDREWQWVQLGVVMGVA